MSVLADTTTLLLTRSCERLMASGLYLRDNSLAGDVQWVREGHGHVLVYNPKKEGVDSSTVASAPVLDVDTTTPSQDSPCTRFTTPPEGAMLTAIVRIDRDHFWLTSDGGYLGPNTICKEILDVKPSCAFTDPGMEPIQLDFPTVLQILHDLTLQCVTPGYSTGTSFFTTEKKIPTGFKLRHRLFEAIDSGVEYDSESDNGMSSSEDLYSFKHWPLMREQSHAELLALKKSHCLRPMPAYDINNDLLDPSMYCHCLQGAIIEVHFTLSHWSIASTKHDIFSSLIKLICILVPAVVSPSIAKKWKLPLHLDLEESPVKRSAH
ncbi:hypothetical protein PISMIDRAFT_13336 [Pisolithus microcarpus 441]|uniref:Uncharacterized protein n=1 Tax=Pisolithus microcarpus 441 TaxID=765257 RepID=A0A0C9Z0U6_9AGAM|nr:hypothetical protein BKA83DRAFT_13336 [Pisolithus microcarpus]KIK19909.1 hypothetical protein PISMIDRAFT_13336 [Pisolithus microcarpus 441]